MTADQFFAPYLENTVCSSRMATRRSRERSGGADAALLDDSVASHSWWPSGGGKTRLLRHSVERIAALNTGRRVWFCLRLKRPPQHILRS